VKESGTDCERVLSLSHGDRIMASLITRAREIWNALRRTVNADSEEDEIAWSTSQEVIPPCRTLELAEDRFDVETEFITPPQSPEHIVESTSITAIRRTPQEIQRNRAAALARRSQVIAQGDKEIYNLFSRLEQAEQSRNGLSIAQCEAVFRQVTTDYVGREGPVPPSQSKVNPRLSTTIIPSGQHSPCITIRHDSKCVPFQPQV
jgi:NhaP-type Na+/H+ and K+/H+ antiporter